MSTADPSRRLGPWRLLTKLGEGGNANVWEARCDDLAEPVALKVVKSQKADREPYRRFVQEVRFLQALEDTSGILPLIDAHLPDEPAAQDPAWLAMPIARPMTEALAGQPLGTVVDAVAAVAETLARLAEAGVAHRDIKPSNLYERDGQWLIGDFGLVAVPDAEEMTRENKPLGPLHFAAYEMIQDPATATPGPADVYSLGKTLWVLATGQAYPPEGHQPADTRKWSIADQRPHPRAEALDRLVDRMTRLHAEHRPTMKQVAEDLVAWKSLSVEQPAIDVTDIRSKILEKLSGRIAAEDAEAQLKELAYANIRDFQRLMEPVNEALRTLDRHANIDAIGDNLTRNILKTPPAQTRKAPILLWQSCSSIRGGQSFRPLVLKVSRSLELFSTGHLLIRTMLFVGYEGLAGADHMWRSEPREALAGSIEASRQLQHAVAELTERFRNALAIYEERLPAPPT